MAKLRRPDRRRYLFAAAMLPLALAVPRHSHGEGEQAAASRAPVILADSNRDGVVNEADRADRSVWTERRGAIVLPNIGDSEKRCPRSSTPGLTDDQLEHCNDANDNVAHAPQNLAPVRILPLRLDDAGAVGRVAATGAGAEKIRIFVQRQGGWTYLGPSDRLTAQELRNGSTLGVDARDIVRNEAVWDGQARLDFTLTANGRQAVDSVAIRVAPVVIHNHLQRAQEIVAPTAGGPVHAQFMKDLTAALGVAGMTTPVRLVQTQDVWAQDFVEFGYVSMPKPGGAATVRIAIRSPQPKRSAGRALFDLRGPGFGVVQTGGDAYHQADSFGNLETVPPYAAGGKRYPVGRVIYGDAGDGYAPHRDWIAFFKAQRVQAPIVLDTSWLAIAHVDEFVQFVPADNARGWTIAVKDVPSALAILRQAQRQGHGGVKAFSRAETPDLTIDQLLADRSLMEDNELARRRVELNLEILKAETGVKDEEIIRVPGLFHESEFSGFIRKARQKDGAPPSRPPTAPAPPPGLTGPREEITYGPGSQIAYYPAAVNGLLIDRRSYIAPKQWGPVVDGVDLLEDAVAKAYAKLGIRTWFIDDWLSHHRIGGEVHCGTNAIRETSALWWK